MQADLQTRRHTLVSSSFAHLKERILAKINQGNPRDSGYRPFHSFSDQDVVPLGGTSDKNTKPFQTQSCL